jgi:uncharacterized protein with NRDE domain
VHGLSNALLDVPWPKVCARKSGCRRGCEAMARGRALVRGARRSRASAERDFRSTGVAHEWERILSSPFIVGERYGTRCSTIFAIGPRRTRAIRRADVRADGNVSHESRLGVRMCRLSHGVA